MKEFGMYLKGSNGDKNLEEIMRFGKQVFIVFLGAMLLLIIGIQVGKYSEVQRLKRLDLYPTKEEVLQAEIWMYKYEMGEHSPQPLSH